MRLEGVWDHILRLRFEIKRDLLAYRTTSLRLFCSFSVRVLCRQQLFAYNIQAVKSGILIITVVIADRTKVAIILLMWPTVHNGLSAPCDPVQICVSRLLGNP